MSCGTRTMRMLVTTLFAAVVLAACGGGSSAQPRLAVPADQILDFTGPNLEGGTFDASTLKGKPTVFWFWAPWCTVCRAEAPSVERIAKKYGASVNFVGVPGRAETPAMKRFVSDTGITSLTNVVDVDRSLWKRFGVTAQPAFAFVAADGEVRTVAGGMKESELDRAVSDLLAQ